ncbi:MAG: methyltransferase domain-containing protein [Candidatus Methanoperedens sp.]|nr:methyltransferase domain-containing protein [Candidatus Methanoperedens sp.]
MSNVEYDTQELAEKYDQISDSQYENGLILIDRLGLNEGSAVLDIGCGTGRLALHTAKIVGAEGKVAGIDPSPLRIEVAGKKVRKKSSGNISFKVGRAENLSGFTDSSFDAIYLCAVFHWIADKKTALKEIHRVLKPRGRVGLTTGDKGNPFTVRQITDELFLHSPYAGHVDIEDDTSKPVTKKELQALFKAAGYENINISTRINKRYYSTPQEVIEFVEASSFGTFLMHVPEHLRTAARHDIEKEVEKKRTPNGIEIVSNTSVAMAQKI